MFMLFMSFSGGNMTAWKPFQHIGYGRSQLRIQTISTCAGYKLMIRMRYRIIIGHIFCCDAGGAV